MIARIPKFIWLLCWISSGFVLPAQNEASGVIRFANRGPTLDVPFFGTDGTNLLSGSNYVAALYIAATNTSTFIQVSPLQRFGERTNDGYWTPVNVAVSPFPPGASVRVQVRFWDQSRLPNATFDQAEAAGAEIGLAEIPALALNADGTPTPLFGLQSASLIPTLTLTRGGPRTVFDAAHTSSGSQFGQLCGVTVGTNRWFRLTSPQEVIAVLNTDGSSIDTVMSAFTGSIVNLASLTPVACNDDRAPGQTSSAFKLSVRTSVLYLICIAGKHSANGPVQLNYAHGVSVEIRPINAREWVEVSWPADAGSYQLETSPRLWSGGEWEPVDAPPFVLDGRFVVLLPGSQHLQGFRLRYVSFGPANGR